MSFNPQEAEPNPSQKPLTVTLVSTQSGWRGGEQQSRLLMRGLRARGHRVTLFAQQNSAMATTMAGEDFPVITFSGRGRSLTAIWKIRKALKKIRPDVLHFNDAHALTAAGIASLGLSIGAKVIARRVNFPIRSPWRYHRLADRMICVSNCVKEVCQNAGFNDHFLPVVYDGVDPKAAADGNRRRGRKSLNLAMGQPLILTVAALSEDKGHTHLLNALPNIVQRYPNVCIALAGEGKLHDELQQQAKQLEIDKNIRFLGFRNDIADLIHAADLFVMPSLVEGLCSSLIDVMFAGCPMVTTTAGGIPELVGSRGDDPPVAQMVPPGDSEQLSMAILDTFTSSAMREDNITRAKQRANDHFTMDQMVDSTLAVYRETLGVQNHPHSGPLPNRKAA